MGKSLSQGKLTHQKDFFSELFQKAFSQRDGGKIKKGSDRKKGAATLSEGGQETLD
jgi:hypothetical protein